MRPILLLTVFLTGCNCAATVDAGTLAIATDCTKDGVVKNVNYPFASFPSTSLSGALQSYFHLDLPAQAPGIASMLDCPTSEGFACQPRGGGTDAGSSSSLIASGAALCGAKLVAVGPVEGLEGFYVCTAEGPLVEAQLWALDCKQFSAEGEPTGTCKAVARFDGKSAL